MKKMPVSYLTTLHNGVRVITLPMPHLYAVTVGIWVDSGSIDELPDDAGAAHFIEHLLFKGTGSRSARQITTEMDELGAQINAFTSHDRVCYLARTQGDNLLPVFDILADMFTDSQLPPEELERERGVVLQEISRDSDDPESSIFTLFYNAFWSDTPLGRPILGNEDVVGSICRDRLMAHIARTYTADRVVVAVAGAVKHEDAVAMVAARLSGLTRTSPPRAAFMPAAASGIISHHKPIEQVQVCLGFNAITAAHGDRHRLALANSILGSGMSSLLFQEVRERRGLAYSVGSFLASHRDSGALLVHTGTSPDKVNEAVQLSIEQCRRVAAGDFDARRFEAAKTQMRGRFLLSLDSTDSQMSRIGRSLLALGRVENVADIVAAIDSLDQGDVIKTAAAYLATADPLTVLLGPSQ